MSSSKRKYTAVELVPGTIYAVTTAFTDYDGIMHPVGETWRFLAKNFLPYEDGLTLQIEMKGRTIFLRLQWRDESQGQIIDEFSNYVEEVKD